MWVPESVEEIETAVRAGNLDETPSFDAKRELPSTPQKNPDLAEDVAAMSTDGGVLLYGVAEDAHKRLTILYPIPLAGAADRIAQIVSMSISEVPYIDVRPYPCPDDPSKGYIAVVVPQSSRAPHQVTVGGDYRYYGRDAKGNRRLNEAEVARLYARREAWSVNREEVLAVVVANAPIPPRERLGFVHAFTRPVAQEQGLFERAAAAMGGTREMHNRLLSVVGNITLRDGYGPSLRSANFWERRGADEWRLSTASEQYHDFDDPVVIEGAVLLSVNIDGRGQLFCGRATGENSQTDRPVVIEVVVAGNVEAFFAVMGTIYEAAGYHGHVDVGVAVTDIQGAGSERRNRGLGGGQFAYSAPGFTRTAGLAAAQLRRPAAVAHSLLRHFYEATTGIDGYNPFTQPQNR